MAEIMKYITGMYCVRDDKFNALKNLSEFIATNLTDIHKKIIEKAHDNGNANAMIFQNELFFIRKLGDVNNNEVKTFLGTNQTWDVLILNSRKDLPLIPLDGYSHVHRVNTTTFNINRVYLVSNRFMQKVKNNDLTNVETYYYDDPFIDGIATNVDAKKVIAGKVESIQRLSNEQIKYTWSYIKL